MNENSLRNDSIWSLIAKFSIPAIIGMVVNAIYNIVDRMFIGKYVGEDALASLMVVFPIMMFTFAVAVLIGQGGANLISINIGKNKRDEANKYFTNTITIGFVVCTLMAVILYIFSEKMLLGLGAEGDVLDYAQSYLNIILLFTPIQCVSFLLSTIVRAEGFPNLSMNALIASALTNIVLDFVFIGLMGQGVAGGALATGIGQTVGLVILTFHFVNKKSTLHFKSKSMVPSFDTIAQISIVGFPSFLANVGVSFMMVVLNKALFTYGGVAAVTSMAAINSIFTLVIMPINGIQGGIQPIIGFSHGAKLHARAKETVAKALILACGFATVAFVVMQTVPTFLLSIFIDSSSDTIEVATVGLRLFMLCLPLIPLNILSVGYFQATQKPRTAIFLGLLRQFLLIIPMILILPHFFELIGVWAAVPIADLISVTVSAILLSIDFKRVDQKEAEKEKPDENNTIDLVNA